jgi:5-methylcytosine-specific restriction endonuclease McrA
MKQFYTRQDEIHYFEQRLNDAINDKRHDLESNLYQSLNHLKELQKLDVRENWSHVINYWFSTNSADNRLGMLLETGIVEIKEESRERFRFITQRHHVRVAITRGKELRFWTYWRDNSQCAYCGKTLTKSNGQIDHVVPISAWPAEFIFLAEDISNLVASCRACNMKKLNYMELPLKEVQHVEIDTCLPKQNSFSELCPNDEQEDCDTCGLPSIQVLCNVHGQVQMQLCKLTAMKKYLGHN